MKFNLGRNHYHCIIFEESNGSGAATPTSAWCSSSSVGNTQFQFTWHIADYQRKKESIKRDDSIQSSTFTVQVKDLFSVVLIHN